MSKINMGGPAYPVSTKPCETGSGYGHQDGHTTWQYSGMSLRDYMAAKAMQSLICLPIKKWPSDSGTDSISKAAYSMADAMILARGEE